ncbi:glycosyltransferase family 2 protein [Porphyromonas pogonae]|uniref:glycosyltransferase family 2 protein n=1 Tax=Porphyromonas pogonae TaxID=867595 RepID=UPI002E770630|nr:glycosyltransferase [Porphyromonas pogonae]
MRKINDTDQLVSIIMPSYNASRFISEAIESVIAQTYSFWELIIVDDCSQDNSLKIINDYILKDDRIKVIPLKSNVSAAEARNIALRNAKGRFIAFLDSDDVWKSDKLMIHINTMRNNNWAFTFSNYELMREDGTLLNKVIEMPIEIDYSHYLRNTIIGCLTVVIDKKQVGYFEMPLIKSSHDMALWLLIMKRGFKAYSIKENIAIYRLVSTSNTSKKWKAAQDVWRVYRKIEKLNIFYSTYNFLGYTFNAIKKRL